jgi:hypothetical protein
MFSKENETKTKVFKQKKKKTEFDTGTNSL